MKLNLVSNDTPHQNHCAYQEVSEAMLTLGQQETPFTVTERS